MISVPFWNRKLENRSGHVNQWRNLNLLELLHFTCTSARRYITLCAVTPRSQVGDKVRFGVVLLLPRHVWDPGPRQEAQAREGLNQHHSFPSHVSHILQLIWRWRQQSPAERDRVASGRCPERARWARNCPAAWKTCSWISVPWTESRGEWDHP